MAGSGCCHGATGTVGEEGCDEAGGKEAMCWVWEMESRGSDDEQMLDTRFRCIDSHGTEDGVQGMGAVAGSGCCDGATGTVGEEGCDEAGESETESMPWEMESRGSDEQEKFSAVSMGAESHGTAEGVQGMGAVAGSDCSLGTRDTVGEEGCDADERTQSVFVLRALVGIHHAISGTSVVGIGRIAPHAAMCTVPDMEKLEIDCHRQSSRQAHGGTSFSP